MSSYKPLGRFLAGIVDTVIDASLVDNTARLLDLLNELNKEKLQRVLTRTDERGFTPLHIAAERNQPESLKCLLIKDANPNIRSTLSSSEVTPLHVAALHGHLACLQLLVQLGGDIMVQDRYHLTPVDYAQINGQDLCFNYLNEVIAQRQAEERSGVEEVLIQVEQNLAIDNVQTLNRWKQLNELFPLSLNTHDPTQVESIMYRHCIVINNRDVVKVLGRITKDIPISLHGASLLHAACRYGHTQLTRLLVQKMPEIMFSITNEAYNPLHVAVVHQHLDIVKILVQTQAGSARNHVHRSTEAGERNRENSLSDSHHLQQARFGEPTMSGHTALHFAVSLGNTDILRVLVRHHRKLKLSLEGSKCGYTPLHLAAFLNHTDCAKLLLKAGANPNASLSAGPDVLTHISHTILSEPVINKNLSLLQTILDYGGEDKGHSAIRLCIPSAEHRPFLVPLLGSLVRLDDGVKLNKQASHKLKTGVAEWGNLQLTQVNPLWIAQAVRCSKFMKSQKIATESACDYLTTVNLSGNMLSWLPLELFQLSSLQIINVSSNQIATLPDLQQTYNSEKEEYEWPCGSLTRLNLSKNILTDLPPFLFKIPSLSHLDVSNNQLLSLPFDLWSAPKLYQMVASFNRLEGIPTNWPEVLSVYQVIGPESPAPQSGARRGDQRKGDRAIKRKQLSIRGHTGTATFEGDSEEPAISRLQDCLNISNSTLPIEWGSEEGREEEYEGLGILNLSNNQICEIPDNLPCLCPRLVRLDLSHNQIRAVSMPRQFPAHLRYLSLSHNLLETLNCRTNLSKPLPCTNPLVLSETDTIYQDDVTFCFHRGHSQLAGLSVLELDHCQLREVDMISPALVGRHRKKKGQMESEQQSGGSCKVQNLEGLVCPLLTRFILSHNVLASVPDSVCDMVSLNSLDLSHNDIIELPPRLGKLYNLWEFPLDGLKLISPPHNIIERGKTRDIIGFLWSLLQRARPYHRMKLMLVGKAARGKTTLLSKISEKGQRGLQENWALNRMMGADHRGNLSTVGVVVSDWTYYKKVRESQTSLRSITFMTWDFGGQEEYYATHQCFISRRSLYLALWNVTHGMAGAQELRPWLLNIQARAPNSPVIIVGTHTDKLNTRQAKEEFRQSLEYIDRMYGRSERQREGFPHIMKNLVVSCKSGRGINELRDAIFDVASQVKENTVAGRGIGCGRIPDYRLLMDQLVPASYLQLEDTVRNLAIQMRGLNKPPVLSYKKLRELVFADPRTLISRHTADRELEQAVRFLHDNGTLLHYEDPLLANFYFVDPQWLCDMLAHIITVREINPFVKEGVMRISDFPLVFNDDEFPMQWQREYIRLLTTFEVAVELSDRELLIPSALPSDKPNLPHSVFPDNLRRLPALCHTYIIPFVPSGFWPRVMSRVLSDKTILQLARNGCNIAESDMAQLTWVKWRQGLILQYGNLNLMTIEEIRDNLFPSPSGQPLGIRFSREREWETVRPNTTISGVSVTVPDFYPILKYLEHAQRRNTAGSLHSTTSEPGDRPIPGSSDSKHGNQTLPAVLEATVEDSLHHQSVVSHDSRTRSDSQLGSHDLGVTEGSEGIHSSCVNRVVDIDNIDEEVKKLANRCKDRCRLLSCDVRTSPHTNSLSNWTAPSEDGSIPAADGVMSRLSSFDLRRRTQDISPQLPLRTLSRGSRGSVPEDPPVGPPGGSPVVQEEEHDKMRAGLIAKAVDHITLLIEDWFTGVKPRYHLVPCPHCVSRCDNITGRGSSGRGNNSAQPVPLLRSFSSHTTLQPPTLDRGAGLTAKHASHELSKTINQPRPRPHPPVTIAHSLPHKPPQNSGKIKLPWRQLARMIAPGHPVPNPVQVRRDSGGGRYLEPERDQGTLLDPYNYAFRYDDCVVLARTQDHVTCPAHGKILLCYMSPDTMFVAQGREMLVSGGDCVEEGVLGQGAYATVFQIKIKKTGESDHAGPYALKTLTKEWSRQTTPPKSPSRYSILTGFSNLKKELAILSPLRNDHVIRLHGIVLCPLGLILEHAPGGSLKRMLEQYHDVQQYLHGNVIQAVIIQVAQAMQYLHSCSIIYRDLKSDNVLVWKFPVPQDSILIPPGQLGLGIVWVKLSDLGISQFAVTQGARGLVGTPGFMAPEILKYHGKEVYTDQVDIFSFGMFMYELLTLHIPYETLTAQQANQANESGSRPSLTRKDLQCPVLLRELMVWCWQPNPDNRPSAGDIISTAQSKQFLRLLNGIRISRGQITAACVAMSSTSPHVPLITLNRRHSYRAIPSPRPPIHTDMTNPFIFARTSADSEQTSRHSDGQEAGRTRDDERRSADSSTADPDISSSTALITHQVKKTQPISSTTATSAHCQLSASWSPTSPLTLSTTTPLPTSPLTLSTPTPLPTSPLTHPTPVPHTLSAPTVYSSKYPLPTPSAGSHGNTKVCRRYSSDDKPMSALSPSSSSSPAHPPPHSRHSLPPSSEPHTVSTVTKTGRNSDKIGSNSPRLSRRRGGSEERELERGLYSASNNSLSQFSEEEVSCEVWVASTDAHRAVLSVVGYCGHFTNLEEIDVGDSSVLSMCAVRNTVWVGFQIGSILIFDSSTHRLLGQTWLKQYVPVISILHIPKLNRVYVTVATGSVYTFQDDVQGSCHGNNKKFSLRPVCGCRDLGQPVNCVVAVPLEDESGSGTSYELWVGQSEARIAVLNTDDLSVVTFIKNTSDTSPTPSYMAYLTYANLVYSRYGDSDTTSQISTIAMETSTQGELKLPAVSVYGALFHGQYVTQWDASSKKMTACHHCQDACRGSGGECKISSLHYHNLQLLVGLCSGTILVLDALTFTPLSFLSCHRGSVETMLSLTLTPHTLSETNSYLHSPYSGSHWTSGSTGRKKTSHNSLTDRPSLGTSESHPNSTNPSPIPATPAYDPSPHSILSNSQSTSSNGSSDQNRMGTQLLSFGSGFKSYYDGPESIPHLKSGFMLVWDLQTDTGVS